MHHVRFWNVTASLDSSVTHVYHLIRFSDYVEWFSDWFGTKRKSAWIQINQKIVNTICFWVDLIRFRKDFTVCTQVTVWLPITVNIRYCTFGHSHGRKRNITGNFRDMLEPIYMKEKYMKANERKIYIM